jgi:hypothetical protein
MKKMQENIKKEIHIKFAIDSRDAANALNLLDKQYSGIADKSSKISAGNNGISSSMAVIASAAQLAKQAFTQLGSQAGPIIKPLPAETVRGASAVNISPVNNEYDTAKQKYKNLNGLAAQHSNSIHKLDEENAQHKIKITEHGLKSVEKLLAEHTAAYKAFAVATAIMDTYQATEAVFKSAAEIPLVGFILAPAVAAAALIAGMQRVNQISAVQVPGYVKGGAVVGEKGPEIIAPFQDYASGQAKLIAMTMLAVKNELSNSNSAANVYAGSPELLDELKLLNKNLENYSRAPVIAKAYLDDREAKRIYNRGSAINRKSKI